MGNARFLAATVITCGARIVPSAQAAGTITKAQKTGGGSGSMVPSGSYTGSDVLNYKVEITTSGDVGAAQYRWSDDGGVTWDASAIVTSTSDAALNNGILVHFEIGAGADFANGDIFAFKAYRQHGRDRAVDLDPNTSLRDAAASTANWDLVVTLAAASAPDAVALYQHNFSSCASILIQAASSSGFPTTPLSETVDWVATAARRYLTTSPRSYQFWRLRVADPGNADALDVAEFYLGAYTEPARNYALGSRRPLRRMAAARERLANGLWTGALLAEAQEFDLTYARMAASERDALLTVYQSLNDADAQRILPVLFDLDAASTARTLYLCEWADDAEPEHESDSPNLWRLSIALAELPKTI